MRVASLVEEVQSAHDRRSALYQSYDDAINKYKSTKDTNTFAATRKKVDTDYKSLTQQIGDLQTKLKNEGSDLAEKVKYRIHCCASVLFIACGTLQKFAGLEIIIFIH